MSEKTADANIYGGNQQSAQFLTRDAGVLLRVQTLLRWLAVSGQSVTIFVVGFVLEYQMPLVPCIGLVLMSVMVNTALWLYSHLIIVYHQNLLLVISCMICCS